MTNKKKLLGILVLTLIFGLILVGCASAPTDPALRRPLQSGEQVVGNVQVTFQYHPRWGQLGDSFVYEDAYPELLNDAKQSYQGDIDIRNISYSVTRLARKRGDTAEIVANGTVVLLSGQNSRVATATGIEAALERAAEQTLVNVQHGARIAIVFITADDRATTDFISGELEFIWVNGGYIISDRSQLDRLRQEQNFQLSGEVDDETAVSIGRFAGADIIVTGRVDGEGSLRRLRLRAIDTQTAQVVGVASERL